MSSAASPLSTPKFSRATGLVFIIPFGLLFAAVGLFAFYSVTLQPLLQVSESSEWRQTECVILESNLATSRGSKGGTNYRIDIRYRYTWSGRSYESDRYDFSGGSTNIGVARMQSAVETHRPGTHSTCLVNPSDPSVAVISRDITPGVWIGSLTLLFPIIGIGMIFFSLRNARNSKSPLVGAKTTGLPSNMPLRGGLDANLSAPVDAGEVELKPASGRMVAFIVMTIFTLFWNGAVGSILSGQIRHFSGGFEWFIVLFFVPFVVIGLVTLAIAIQCFSRLFTPPVKVRLDPSLLRLGARTPFSWRLGGSGVRRLTISLIAREEATYRQGTRTRTDKSDFLREIVIESTDSLSLNDGRSELRLPDVTNAVPTFAGSNNRIVWELAFAGEIPWRADVADCFPLPVRAPTDRNISLPAPGEPRPTSGGGVTLWTVDRFAPGETLVCTVARDAGATPGPLTLQLGWFTEGRGTRDAAIEWSTYLPDLAPGSDKSIETQLPAAPWSFSGKLVAVEWRLEVLDAKRNPLITVPIVIGPGGSAVTLPEAPKVSLTTKWKRVFNPGIAR